MSNLLLLTDSYKVTHHCQYPPKTEQIYSYLESRGGSWPKTLFFGLQYFLKKYLSNPITDYDIVDAKVIFKEHFGTDTLFNEYGWRHILNAYEGRLPVKIKAVPEGTLVDLNNVLVTVENTDPDCYWLTNYLETLLSQVWYPTTAATLDYYIRQLILGHLEATGTPESINFKLHDFGFRGVSSVESAGIGGLAHLVNFRGTDNLAALMVGKKYYNEPMAGYSIPASEHSTMTAWGKDNEVDASKNMLGQYSRNNKMIACVGDSFDIYNTCKNIWGTELKGAVIKSGVTLVIRPDSGDPVEVVTKCLEILDEKFGSEPNQKGYKVLKHVKLIQGDGVNYGTIDDVLGASAKAGYSADNVGFGSGGALLQKMNRDTFKFAFKCSHATIDGKEVEVYKDPITDPGKTSKKGKLVLHKEGGTYCTSKLGEGSPADELVEVFTNGFVVRDQSLRQIRDRSNRG